MATSTPEQSAQRAPGGKALREGSARKRAAILAAARELFVRDGVERVSMDAVAARAGVSKRTVYDYYGDKRRLLLGVIEDAGESVLVSIRKSIDEHLSGAAEIRDTAELERALTAFAVQLGTSVLATTDYIATVKLITENASQLPELENHPLDIAHEQAVAERIAHFAALGLLDTDNPKLAADHFTALTTLLAYNDRHVAPADPARMRQIMIDGTHAFMRAYARR